MAAQTEYGINLAAIMAENERLKVKLAKVEEYCNARPKIGEYGWFPRGDAIKDEILKMLKGEHP